MTSLYEVAGIILKTLECVGAVVCYYSALLLYPDEQGRIQNKLEDWWVNLHDAERTAISKAALFMRGVAVMTSKTFDFVFGRDIVSLQSVVVSVWLSFASMSLFAIIDHPPFVDTPPDADIQITSIAFFVMCVLFVYLTALFKTARYVSFFFWAGVVGIMLHEQKEEGLFVVAMFGTSALFDTIFVAMMRKLLQWSIGTSSAFRYAVSCFGMAGAGIGMFVLPFVYASNAIVAASNSIVPPEISYVELVAIVVGLSNFLDALVAVFLFFVTFVLLLNRLLWPLMSRVLYGLAVTKVRRGVLVTVGSALITIAAEEPMSKVLKDVVRSL